MITAREAYLTILDAGQVRVPAYTRKSTGTPVRGYTRTDPRTRATLLRERLRWRSVMSKVRPTEEYKASVLRETRRNLSRLADRELLRAAQRNLERILLVSKPYIRVPGVGIMHKILDDGRWKSQHEVLSSRGLNNPEARAGYERQLFGYPSELPKEQRPIYAYLSDDGPFGQSADVRYYGGIAVELKPEVKEHATWTPGDSLDRNLLPVPALRPDIRAFGSAAYYLEHGLQSLATASDLKSIVDAYAELQIHGQLKTSEIRRVFIHEALYYDPVAKVQGIRKVNANAKRLRERLQAMGIEFRVMQTFERQHDPEEAMRETFYSQKAASSVVAVRENQELHETRPGYGRIFDTVLKAWGPERKLDALLKWGYWKVLR